MNHPSAVLAKILVRERYSLLQYLSTASPWTPPSERAALGRLERLAAAEKDALGRISRRLQELRVTPLSGCYPEQFSEYHYLAVDYLLPRLIQEQEKAIAQLEADLTQLSSDEDRQAVEPLLEQKRNSLEELRKLAEEYAGTAAATRR